MPAHVVHAHKNLVWQRRALTAWLAGSVAIALVTVTLWPTIGVFVNAAVFTLLIATGMARPRLEKTTVLLAVIPMANLIIVTLPIEQPFARMATFYSILFGFATIYRLLLLRGHVFPQLRSGRGHSYIAASLAVGAGLGILASIALLGAPSWLSGVSLWLLIPSCVVFAVTEELLFRGLIMEQAARVVAAWRAIILTVIVYACLTLSLTSPENALVGCLSALVLCLTYRFTTNLVTTFAMNVAMKISFVVMLGVFGA